MHRAPAHPILVVAFRAIVFGVDASSGAIRWEVDLDSYGEVEIAIEEGVVIAATAGKIAFIDYTSGHVHAIVPMPGEHAGRPTMIVSGGSLYVAGNGETRCLTLRGQPVWVQSFRGKGMGAVSLGVPGAIRQADDVGSR